MPKNTFTRKTFDLDDSSLSNLRRLMEFYGEPTEIGAIRRSLEDLMKLTVRVRAGAELYLEQGGQRVRILAFEQANMPNAAS